MLVDVDDHWTSLNRSEFTQNLLLEVVSIENNHILSLEANLSQHTALRELHLNDNSRFDLDLHDVANLVSASLRTLQVGGCDLDRIGNGTFERLPQLQSLVLDRNALTEIPVNMLAGTDVRQLSMSGNYVYNFPPDKPILNSSLLTVFRCNKCAITRVYTDTFELLPALLELELNGNQISIVYTQAFAHQPLLQVIQLNENELVAYPLEALRSPPLRELCLDGNNFTASIGTTFLKERVRKYGLRAQCPINVPKRLDDIEDTRLPGISDAFIASYLVLIVVLQAVFGVLALMYCLRHVYVSRTRRRRGSEEFDYSAGVVNESLLYRYVK